MTTSFQPLPAVFLESREAATQSAASAGHLSEHVTAGPSLGTTRTGSMECDGYSHLRCRQSTCFGPPTLFDALDHQQRNALFLSTFTSVCVRDLVFVRTCRAPAAVHCDMPRSTSSPRTRHFFIPDTRAPCRYQHPAQLLPLVRIVAIPFKLDSPSRSSDVFILILFLRS
ncbi:hypothetical protein C8R45DRAFT_528076 [Mycena sanguinolenta]|nr:hypothetical protein C8R45DRAFT_528076 [Mycena sanguinolenta]